jgi:hypothetical protein
MSDDEKQTTRIERSATGLRDCDHDVILELKVPISGPSDPAPSDAALLDRLRHDWTTTLRSF